MARFDFNLCNRAEFIEDDEGDELVYLAAARARAAASLGDVMAGDLRMSDLNAASFIRSRTSGTS